MKTKILIGGLLVVLFAGVIFLYPAPDESILTEPTKTPTVSPLSQDSTVSQEELRTTKDIPKQPNTPDAKSSEEEFDLTNLPQPVEFVRQYMADSLGITYDSIKVVQVEHVVWSDGCFELPAPELCISSEVPGFRVTLQVMDKRYVYHTDEFEGFIFAGSSDVQNE